MQRNHLLVTAVGPDRIGFVDEVTSVLAACGANVEESRMARLAGDFAALLLISVSEERIQELADDLNQLSSRDIEISFRLVRDDQADAFRDYGVFALTVTGADHEGIIRSIAHELTQLGINIAELESEVVNAPTTGTPLFNMTARIQIPPSVSVATVEQRLKQAADQTCVTAKIEAAPAL